MSALQSEVCEDLPLPLSTSKCPNSSAPSLAKPQSCPPSLSQIYEQHREELCRYLQGKCGLSHHEAEDIMHSVFAQFVGLEAPEAVLNPRAYLYTCSHNLAMDHIRHLRVRAQYLETTGQQQAEAVETLGPDRIVEARRYLDIFSRALWNMPQKRRQLLLMSRFDGLSYAEIARRVGLSETVVRKHIAKALADCQQAIQTQRG